MSQSSPDYPGKCVSKTPVVGELLDPEDKRAAFDSERSARLLSYWLDSVFEIPGLGWRFGLDPIIGLVPVAGDVATALVSLYILSLAIQLRVPSSTVARMTVNVGIDYVLGSIPLVGRVFDFAWKANRMNVKLLDRALATPVHERGRQTIWDWIVIASVLALLVGMFIGSIALAVLLATWIAQGIKRLR